MTTHPLVYLRRREAVNTVRGAVSSPRRMGALLLFGLLMVVFVGEPILLAVNGTRTPRFLRTEDVLNSARLVLAGWFVLHSLQWVRAGLSDRVLLLPQAHYDWLFPAPVSRRALVLNHLLGSYLPFVWGSPMMALPIVAAAGVWFPEFQPALFAVTILTFLLFDLAAFNLTTLVAVYARGGGTGRRSGAILLRGWLLLALAVVVGVAIWRAAGASSFGDTLSWLPAVLLIPFFGLADLGLAPLGGLPAWGLAVLVALALAAGGSLWLLLDRFAEATEPGRDAAASSGSGSVSDGWTRGLSSLQGERAMVWKTLLALRRGGGRVLLVVGIGVVGLTAAALGPPMLVLAAAPLAFLLYYGLLAESLFGIFASDLERGELLRSLPLRPARVLAISLSLLIAVGVGAGWLALLAGWLTFAPQARPWLLLAAAELPLLVPLLFLVRGLFTTLFPPQREAETLDMIYAAAVELAVLGLSLFVLVLPLAALMVAIFLRASPPLAWAASAATALPLLAALWWALLRAYRSRG